MSRDNSLNARSIIARFAPQGTIITSPSRFDVEFPKAAFQDGRLASPAGDNARAHFHSRRLIAIEVAVELRAAFAADQGPVAPFGGPLVEAVDRGAKVVEAPRPAGDQKRRRRNVPHQIFQFYPL